MGNGDDADNFCCEAERTIVANFVVAQVKKKVRLFGFPKNSAAHEILPYTLTAQLVYTRNSKRSVF